MELHVKIFDVVKRASRSLRICACAVGLLAMAVTSTVSAEIAPEQAALGGITLGAPTSYVRSIYGTGSVSREHGVLTYRYHGASVSFWSENGPGKVMNIDTWKNNGFATPAGVTVGMSSSILYDLYGQPDWDLNRRFITRKPVYADTQKNYVYFVSGSDRYKYLVFYTDSNDVINEIVLHWAD